jgi:hypothetical protein
VEARPRRSSTKLKCCEECIQCENLKWQGADGIQVEGHHNIQVRTVILLRHETVKDNERQLSKFRLNILDRKHKEKPDRTIGVVPYWRKRKFFDRLYGEAKNDIKFRWPFADLKAMGVAYKLIPTCVTYTGYSSEGERSYKIVNGAKPETYDDLPPPVHTHYMTRGIKNGRPAKVRSDLDGQFTVYLTVECETSTAIKQRIAYADDMFAQRLKQITADSRGRLNRMHTIGAILLTCATHQREERHDRLDPKVPPYGKADLKDTMDDQSWKDYKHLLDFYRSRDEKTMGQEKDMTAAPQKSGKESPTSSTHGHPMDTKTSDVRRSGTIRIATGYIKDTNSVHTQRRKKDDCRDSTGTHCFTKPAQPEKSWSNSTRRWTPRSRSRDGGREYSDTRRDQRTVFDRLSTYPRRDEDNDDKAKRSKITGSKKTR